MRNPGNERGASSAGLEAVILAAGCGRRLGGAVGHRPKSLIGINGTPLIIRSLQLLSSCGITKCHIVVGYGADLMRAALGESVANVGLTFHYNEEYADGGSASSLACYLRNSCAPQALVLESDLLYHCGFIRTALAQERSHILAADQSGSGDEVFVGLDRQSHVRQLSKRGIDVEYMRLPGEFAGITRLNVEAVACLAHRARGEVPKVQGDYEDLLVHVAIKGGLSAFHCVGLPWCEVDTVEDLVRSRSLVWLQLQLQESRSAMPCADAPSFTEQYDE